MTSQDLLSFTFNSKAIRVTDQNGDPWFILRDLLDAMGSATKVTDAVESIKQGLGEGFANDVPLQTKGGIQKTIIVSESAATYLLSRSNTEKGRELNRFIHVEVLPSIRKTGKYEAAPSNPAQNFNDPIIGALVHGLMEIDTIKQQQAAIVQQQAALDYKTAVITSRLEHVELQHRHGVPDGYLSKSHAHHLYSRGLSEDVFHRAMLACGVTAQNYIHTEDGHETQSVAYLESEIAPAVEVFLRDARQVTRLMCESPMLNGKRFRYIKVNGYEVAA